MNLQMIEINRIHDYSFFCGDPELIMIMNSIKDLGIVEPLIVIADNEDYKVLDGRLRLRACQELGIVKLPCLIWEGAEGDYIHQSRRICT